MPSKEREYIDRMKRECISPIEIQREIIARYGTNVDEKMSFDEANDIYYKVLQWALWHNIAVQDYMAFGCGKHIDNCDEHNPQPFVSKVIETVDIVANHLTRGKELGLNDLEQQVIDTLWSWIPHNYQENYVACTREVSKVIKRLLPQETEPRTEEGYYDYCGFVIDEIKQISQRYDVEFDSSDESLTVGYFQEWLSEEYGLILDDAWDREV